MGAAAHDRGAASTGSPRSASSRASTPGRGRSCSRRCATRSSGLPQPFAFRYRTDVYVFPRALASGLPRDAAGVPADEAVRRDRAARRARGTARSSQPSATSSATWSPWKTTGSCVARVRAAARRPRAEHELAVLERRGSRPTRSRRARRAPSTTARSTSSASPPRFEDPVDRLERAGAHAAPPRTRRRASRNESGTGTRPARLEVDQDERLLRGRHQHVGPVVVEPVGGVVVGDARRPDPLDADEDLEQVVEARRRVVLDVRRAHRELAADARSRRGAGGTRCARGRSTAGSARSRRRPARRCPRTRRACRPRTGTAACGRSGARARSRAGSAPSTSSRFASISSRERASRFRRRSGSVFDGRTFMCQSSASIERPSRCETRALGAEALLQLLQLQRDVGDRRVDLAGEEVARPQRREDLAQLLPARSRRARA